MNTRFMLSGLLCLILVGCGIEETIRKNEDRYAKPGAMDMAISSNPYYVKHSFTLLNRYVVKQEWINGSASKGIAYGGYFGKPKGLSLRIFDSLGKIYEEQGATWYQADKSYAGINPKTGQYWRSDFNRYVRAEYLSGPNGSGVIRIEKGYNPLSLETWWNTSHSIMLLLHRMSLSEMKAKFTKWYPEGAWSTKTINNLTWHVQETPEDKFRLRPLNGVGGPFQTWVLPLADTGYTMAIELGASKESLQYSEAHARMQVMFKHLIESVKIEPVPVTSANTPPVPVETVQPASPINQKNSETKSQPSSQSGSTSTPVREYPDRTQRIQQNMQRDSNRDMKNLLRNTAPKAGR
jgi:hypothetical protein